MGATSHAGGAGPGGPDGQGALCTTVGGHMAPNDGWWTLHRSGCWLTPTRRHVWSTVASPTGMTLGIAPSSPPLAPRTWWTSTMGPRHVLLLPRGRPLGRRGGLPCGIPADHGLLPLPGTILSDQHIPLLLVPTRPMTQLVKPQPSAGNLEHHMHPPDLHPEERASFQRAVHSCCCTCPNEQPVHWLRWLQRAISDGAKQHSYVRPLRFKTYRLRALLAEQQSRSSTLQPPFQAKGTLPSVPGLRVSGWPNPWCPPRRDTLSKDARWRWGEGGHRQCL